MITPSSLHFERHHAGVPTINPHHHELLVHGLVERPLVFTRADLLRLPVVSRIHFLECAGNTANEQVGNPGPTPQLSHGLFSRTEWTGVLLRDLLNEAGMKSSGSWVLAEGGDACRLARSLPLRKALDDVLAYGLTDSPRRSIFLQRTRRHALRRARRGNAVNGPAARTRDCRHPRNLCRSRDTTRVHPPHGWHVQQHRPGCIWKIDGFHPYGISHLPIHAQPLTFGYDVARRSRCAIVAQ
jgi:hypothetical protein